MSSYWSLISHEHTLRLKHHRHTSYPGLLFLLLVTGTLLLGVSFGAQGAVQNPQSGSVGLTGTVAGPPPAQAATILSPSNGDSTTSSPVTVRGTCLSGMFVFIEKNGVLAGEAACTGGQYSLQVDLFDGVNQLVARVVDGLGQYGPDSSPVTITYNDVADGSPVAVSGRQLFLNSDATVVAGEPNSTLTRTVKIVGGTSPYAISWDWGDGATSLATVSLEGPVSSSHAYASPGTYTVIVRVSDASGNAAFLQLVTVVNGPVAAVTAGSSKGGALPGKLLMAWPLLGIAIVMVAVFWLGERRAARRLRRRQVEALPA